MKRLRRLLDSKSIVRLIEAHNGLTGLIVENLQITKDDLSKEFDGMWLSSLTIRQEKENLILRQWMFLPGCRH